MSESCTSHTFQSVTGATAVLLPFELDAVIRDINEVRKKMIRERPETFTRDEWAYLLGFFSGSTMELAFRDTFGDRVTSADLARCTRAARPRGTVSVWLPSNVSLLGPLCLSLLLVTGNRLLLKGASDADDLTGEFIRFLRRALPSGVLRTHLDTRVRYEIFDRHDPRSAEWSAAGDLRIVFGGDVSAASIDQLPHPLESTALHFSDRRSEAWVSARDLSDEELSALVRVFAIYGQAGCTSPGSVVVLDGTQSDARMVRDRLAELWPRVLTEPIPEYAASANVMAWQWCQAHDIDARLTEGHMAVLALADRIPLTTSFPRLLPVAAMSLDNAIERLPSNIQTIGITSGALTSDALLRVLALSNIRRVVPIRRMHHFSHQWDGRRFWSEAFSVIELPGA